MKRFIFFLLPVLLLACQSNDYDSLFKEHTDFPYVIDSLFMSSVNDESYSILEGSDLKILYRDVKKINNEYGSMIKKIIEYDSLKKKNISEAELEKLHPYPIDHKIFALHKFQFASGTEGYSWYLSMSPGGYIFLDQVFITLYKNEKPSSCFRAGLISVTYQDAHNYIDIIDSEVFIGDRVKIKSYHYEDNDQGYSSEKTELKELIIKSGDIELVQSEELNTSEEEIESNGIVDFDGITVGNGTKLYAEATFESDVTQKFNTGELVKIISQSKKRETENTGKQCDNYGYFWYKIKDSNNREGWVFGKNLFKIFKKEDDEIFNKTYQFENKHYYFTYASDLSYGASDKDGLTGCDMYYLPFFYDEEGKKLMLLHYSKDKFDPGELDWSSALFDEGLLFLLLDSDGGSDRIIGVNPTTYEGGMPCIEVKIENRGQDGSSTYSLFFEAGNSVFELSVVHYDE